MPGALAIGALALIVACFQRRRNLRCWLAPFAALWLASPAVARWVSLPPRIAEQETACPATTRSALRLTARRTWRFFETFVTAADHMLPPDNFQEDPTPARGASHLADQSRPLSAVAGQRPRLRLDRPREAIERLEATLATMGGMERFRGHFYNWYDTGDLRPLDPQYVSSVDSGNLAGHLIALANACREWRTAPIDANGVPGRHRRRARPDARRRGRLRDGRQPRP